MSGVEGQGWERRSTLVGSSGVYSVEEEERVEVGEVEEKVELSAAWQP